MQRLQRPLSMAIRGGSIAVEVHGVVPMCPDPCYCPDAACERVDVDEDVDGDVDAGGDNGLDVVAIAFGQPIEPMWM